jgi:hypothetical protein
MTIQRIRAKGPLSSEQRARNNAVQAFLKLEKPGPDELTAGGRFDESLPFEAYMDFRVLIQSLKEEREKQGLTLAELAAATRLDAGMLRRLEIGSGSKFRRTFQQPLQCSLRFLRHAGVRRSFGQ